jgi:hypothetical protein
MSGLVQGYVTTPAPTPGAAPVPVPTAQVRLLNPTSGAVVAQATTDTDGYYYIDHDLTGQPLAAGDYLLKETAPGYTTTGASFNTMFNSATVNADNTINVHVVDLAQQTFTIQFGVAGSTQIASVSQPDGSFEQTYSGGYYMTYTTTDSNGVTTTTTLPINCIDPYHNVYSGQSFQVSSSA